MKKLTFIITILSATAFLFSCGQSTTSDSSKKSLENIEMYTLPQTHFEYQEPFNYDNATIKLFYNDNYTEIILVNEEMITIPSMTNETEIVNVTYGGFTTFYEISVELLPPSKVDPTISFTISNGAVFTYDGTGEPPLIRAYVEEDDCEYITYFVEENGINIGTECPTEPGSYSFVCEVNESAKYNEKREWRWFKIVHESSKLNPVITFSISNGAHFLEGSVPEIIVTLNDSSIEYSVYYTADDGETNLGAVAPTAPGTYAINVQTIENEKYNAIHAFRWYVIDPIAS